MKKFLFCLAAVCLLVLGMLPLPAEAAEDWRCPDLSGLVNNDSRREYMEMMIGHYLKAEESVRTTLKEGYSAVFFFEGASDNMDDPELSDISYYRVSAVCIALRLGEDGVPYLSYFNQACSTLPDRPLAYGAWNIADVGEVGPATICDGTYELFSVKHGGQYEALHIRTDEGDDTIPAVYMTPEGFCMSRADMINIHTRNVNHILETAMWSAGCVLIGDGDFGIFTELIESTYYSVYDTFDIGYRVGTVTLDRQLLKEELYTLYENRNAVDTLLAYSRHSQPETYLLRCGMVMPLEEAAVLYASEATQLMSLPCTGQEDTRARVVAEIPKGEGLEITGSIENPEGETWYTAEYEGQSGYVYSEAVEQQSWLRRFFARLFG